MTPTERLRLLAKELRKPLPPHTHFSLRVWRYEGPGCGTVCCAIGYAMTLPTFQAEGFKPKRLGQRFNGEIEYAPYLRDGDTPMAASLSFFGIDVDDFRRIFENEGYAGLGRDPTPEDVADRIDQVASEYETG